MPKVLNKRTDFIPPDAILVDRTTKWGNRYKIAPGYSREDTIEDYRQWLAIQIHLGLLDPAELTGHDLVCWCAPLPCHADVLLELANK